MTTCWICGDCLSLIPVKDRIPTDKQRDFDATFGPMRANVNDRGWYQSCDSSMMSPRFWVSSEALEIAFPPGCKLMTDFYPFVRMERFLEDMVKAEREGLWPPWSWEKRSRDQLLMEFGSPIRKYLGLPPAPKVEDNPRISLTGDLVDVPPGQARLAQELWQSIVNAMSEPGNLYQIIEGLDNDDFKTIWDALGNRPPVKKLQYLYSEGYDLNELPDVIQTELIDIVDPELLKYALTHYADSICIFNHIVEKSSFEQLKSVLQTMEESDLYDGPYEEPYPEALALALVEVAEDNCASNVFEYYDDEQWRNLIISHFAPYGYSVKLLTRLIDDLPWHISLPGPYCLGEILLGSLISLMPNWKVTEYLSMKLLEDDFSGKSDASVALYEHNSVALIGTWFALAKTDEDLASMAIHALTQLDDVRADIALEALTELGISTSDDDLDDFVKIT